MFSSGASCKVRKNVGQTPLFRFFFFGGGGGGFLLGELREYRGCSQSVKHRGSVQSNKVSFDNSLFDAFLVIICQGSSFLVYENTLLHSWSAPAQEGISYVSCLLLNNLGCFTN